MKTTKVIVCILALVCGARLVLAGGWDYLWGKWQEKGNPQTYFVFSPTNIVASVHGTQEVWQVVGGLNLIMGLTVTRADQKVEAKSMVKFDEMLFNLGERHWLLKKSSDNTNAVTK